MFDVGQNREILEKNQLAFGLNIMKVEWLILSDTYGFILSTEIGPV